MSEKQRAVCRGGDYDGVPMPVEPDQNRLYFVAGDSGTTKGVYGRTDEIEQSADGPSVVFTPLDPTADDK